MRLDVSTAPAGVPVQSEPGERPFAPAPAPAWAVNRVEIIGDSITSTDENQTGFNGDFYSYVWKNANTAIAVSVNAQASRTVGGPALNGDGADDGTPAGNTLLANATQTIAFAPDLVTVFIGHNDFSTFSVATYQARLIAWARAIRTANRRIAYAPPLPRRRTNPTPTFVAFTARRSLLMAAVRDPAVWGQWADYYIPLGEHPDFLDSANDAALYSDGVHPSGPVATASSGQARLHAVFAAAMDSLADQSRANATTVFSSTWPTSESSLATGTQITRRFIVRGAGHTGLTMGASVAGSGAELRLNGGAWGVAIGNQSGNGHRLYNGDVVDLRLITSALNDTAVSVALTIGSETRTLTYRTVANVAEVAYLHGGELSEPNPAAARTFSAVPFTLTGMAVLGVLSKTSSPINSVTIGGVPATRVMRQMRGTVRAIEVWTCPVAAGNHDITIANPASRSHHVVTYGVLQNADPTPVAGVGNEPTNQSAPHLTPPFTVPASGLALAWFLETGGAAITPATANVPTMFVGAAKAIYQNATEGLALGLQRTSGQASFNFAFGTYARTAIVFKARGT